jgi:hypothetical protein
MIAASHPAGVLVAALVLSPACGSPGSSVSSPERTEDYVGKDAKVALDVLRFHDPAEATRFQRVRACFAARPAGEVWRHYPLRRIGNFVQEDWCRGEHSSHCSGGSFRSERGDEWYEVFTLHYDRSWPEVFGLGVSAGRLPREGDWGVAFSYTANGARIIGESMSLSFYRFDGERIAQEVHLGSAHVYQVEETQIQVDAPGTDDEELARLIASPESLQTTALARLDALSVEVERQIGEGTVRKCVYGPYAGDGIPPVCTPTPLTAAEQAAALASARTELGARRDAVTRHAAEFQRLITELMAFDRCW